MLIAAGIIGVLLSLAGITGLWLVRPAVTTSLHTVLSALSSSVDTSQQAMNITDDALDASIQGFDGLSEVIHSMENSVKNATPAVEAVSGLLNDTLPASVKSATDSLNTARNAAVSLEGAVKQLDLLQSSLNNVPFLNSLIPDPAPANEQEKPLSDSLGELSGSLEDIPSSFQDVSRDLDKAAGDLQSIQKNLGSISESVDSLSSSLKEYKGKLAESRSSLESLKSMLTSAEENLDPIVITTAIVFSLLFFCLLMTQVVVIDEGRRFLDSNETLR
jgi:methyl-accepting chemotaxis protein